MFDTCTVVFGDELGILRVQAQSLDRFAYLLDPGTIMVVVNDDIEVLDRIHKNWWGNLQDRVQIIHRDQLTVPTSHNGWVTQQLYKLLASAHSSSAWTVVLDAKTLLVRLLKPSQLINDQEQITSGFLPVYPVFEPSRRITEQMFGIGMSQQIGPGGVPFVFHNQSVRDMIKECQIRSQQDFGSWFQQQGCLTEFMLYSGYVQYANRTKELYNSVSTIFPVNVCHSDIDRFDQKFQNMLDPQTSSVSIHRRAWRGISNNQRKQYQNLLLSRGLDTAQSL